MMLPLFVQTWSAGTLKNVAKAQSDGYQSLTFQ
jgi:hypothetical protein